MLASFETVADPRLLVDASSLDDAGVVKLREDLAVVVTADFITPVVDDPFAFGRIAAANSLSDVYAMGAQPVAALNIVAWPCGLDAYVLREVLRGGAASAASAGCLVVGGHTVDDQEPKYGMAVVGTVHPDRIVRNVGAKPGDVLYLTKPLGTGILATAMKAELASEEQLAAALASMSTLNRAGAEAALAAGVSAMTDVTGFGLIGHLTEMLGADEGLGVTVDVSAISLLPGVLDQVGMGMVPGGAYRNRDAFAEGTDVEVAVPDAHQLAVFDPQTSGGLLVAVPSHCAGDFEREAAARGVAPAQMGRFDRSGRIRLTAS